MMGGWFVAHGYRQLHGVYHRLPVGRHRVVDGVERAHRALSAFGLVHLLHYEEARKGGVRNLFRELFL